MATARSWTESQPKSSPCTRCEARFVRSCTRQQSQNSLARYIQWTRLFGLDADLSIWQYSAVCLLRKCCGKSTPCQSRMGHRAMTQRIFMPWCLHSRMRSLRRTRPFKVSQSELDSHLLIAFGTNPPPVPDGSVLHEQTQSHTHHDFATLLAADAMRTCAGCKRLVARSSAKLAGA